MVGKSDTISKAISTIVFDNNGDSVWPNFFQQGGDETLATHALELISSLFLDPNKAAFILNSLMNYEQDFRNVDSFVKDRPCVS